MQTFSCSHSINNKYLSIRITRQIDIIKIIIGVGQAFIIASGIWIYSTAFSTRIEMHQIIIKITAHNNSFKEERTKISQLTHWMTDQGRKSFQYVNQKPQVWLFSVTLFLFLCISFDKVDWAKKWRWDHKSAESACLNWPCQLIFQGSSINYIHKIWTFLGDLQYLSR